MSAVAQSLKTPFRPLLLRYGIACLACALLHLPFAFLKMPSPEMHHSKKGLQLPAVVSLPSAANPDLSLFEKDLYAWAEIADPSRMLHPDQEFGFSRYGTPQIPVKTPKFPTLGIAPFQLPKERFPENVFSVTSNSLSEFIRTEWNTASSVLLPPLEVAPPAQGVFWRVAGSTRLLPTLKLDGEFQALAKDPAQREKIHSTTLLEVLFRSPLPYPRILVRNSCGNSRFDQLAVRGMRQFFLEQYSKTANAQSAQRLPVAGSWQFEVDWRLPQFGK